MNLIAIVGGKEGRGKDTGCRAEHGSDQRAGSCAAEVQPGRSGAGRRGRAPLPPVDSGGVRLAALICADLFSVAVGDIYAARRGRARAALARQVSVYIAHVSLGLTYAQLAAAFRRDRTTIAHACRLIEDMRDDTAFDAKVAQAEAELHRLCCQHGHLRILRSAAGEA